MITAGIRARMKVRRELEEAEADVKWLRAENAKLRINVADWTASSEAYRADVERPWAALKDILGHMERNGMQDWPVANKARRALEQRDDFGLCGPTHDQLMDGGCKEAGEPAPESVAHGQGREEGK